jgi:hypothetical protein
MAGRYPPRQMLSPLEMERWLNAAQCLYEYAVSGRAPLEDYRKTYDAWAARSHAAWLAECAAADAEKAR